jgi:NuA3 HAT complex component NTO1
METFSSMELTRRNFAGMGPAGRSRLTRRIQFAERLVVDLERLKALSEAVMNRESEKLKEVELEEEAVNAVYFPIWRLLPHILERALT